MENLRIDIYHHFPSPDGSERMEKLEKRLDALEAQENEDMATIADVKAANDTLAAAVTAQDTVVDSAVVLVNGFNGKLVALQAQLDAAIAANDPVATQAVSDAIAAESADITTRTAALAAAVAQNTPAPVTAPTVAVAPTPPAAS